MYSTGNYSTLGGLGGLGGYGSTYGRTSPPLGMASAPYRSGSPILPPAPVGQPLPTESDHVFQSQNCGSTCEAMVDRQVQYQTEWVQVPVQKPVVTETYQKVYEVPTQHMVSVQNMPGDCGPAAPYGAGLPRVGSPYRSGVGIPTSNNYVAPPPPAHAGTSAFRPSPFYTSATAAGHYGYGAPDLGAYGYGRDMGYGSGRSRMVSL